jgi:sialate O-acetylesterase
MDRLVYGKTVALSPQPVGHSVKDQTVAVIFDQPMREGVAYEVEVAGADKRFVNVEATVAGAEVRFQSPIAQPVWVRYAWKDAPRASICNKTGLPAMPFEYELTR